MPTATITAEQLRMSAMILIPMACLPAYIAKKKGRSFLLWYIYAYGFFIIALIHSLMLLPRQTARNVSSIPNYNSAPGMAPVEFTVNKKRINYCFIGCPMDTLSYVILSKPAEKKLVVNLNLFAEKPIKAFDITLEIFDTMNGKIADKVFNNVSYSDTVSFDISEYPYAMYINFSVEQIYFENGEEWTKQGQRLEYDIDVLDGYELERLKGLTNKYAVCLPYKKENYWICSCSKANNADKCVLCGIEKNTLFEKVDKDTVRELKNDLIRRNNLSKLNLSIPERQA